MKRKLLVTFLLFALAACAADFTGKWNGTLTDSGEGHEAQSAYFIFKQDGAKITGTAGPNAETQLDIINAKMTGDVLTFDVSTPSGAIVHFTLKVDGNHLKGDANGESGGEAHSAKIEATKVE